MLKLKPVGSLSIDPLEPKRLRVVIATIVINVVAVALLAFAPWSNWKTGLALNLFDNALLLGFVYLHRDELLLRFMLLGVVAGFTELVADAWLVGYTHTLDYSIGGGPMFWRSPMWMPFAWEIVVVQFGYLGLRLQEHFGRFGLVIIGLLGAINIPYYEEMAWRIHWWKYSGCRMISGTPYYIIVGEFFIAVSVARLVKKFRRGSIFTAAQLGVVAGGAIFVSYAIAYGLTDGLFHK
ncbi:MAG TPA: hypothetical protein VH251_08030 [Verrucomicrobiae bacterium]|jgi:hypothetical protein|nr:hypothetical protein [Verrucomicrobiae bacterium]